MHHPSSIDLHGQEADGSIHVMLGRLMERSEHTARAVDRIETRLEHGDERMDGHESRLARLESEPKKSPDQPSRMERLAMRHLAYIIPTGALYLTDGWQAALRWLAAAIKP